MITTCSIILPCLGLQINGNRFSFSFILPRNEYRFAWVSVFLSLTVWLNVTDCLQVVKALSFLQHELNVIHRDVKPSNILASRKGEIKMCDFGISGQLVDSVAKTIDAGCKPYMAVSEV